MADDFEILVVNDGSQDGSAAVLDSLARELPCLKVITHPANRGYGGALRSGFSNATKELVFYTDGDGQYDVGELPLLLMLLTPDTDFVNGMKMTRQDPGYRVFAGNLHRFADAVVVLAADHRRGLRLPAGPPFDHRARAPHAEQRVDLRRAGEAGAASRGAVSRGVGPPLRARVRRVAVLPPGPYRQDVLDLARLWVELMLVAPIRG